MRRPVREVLDERALEGLSCRPLVATCQLETADGVFVERLRLVDVHELLFVELSRLLEQRGHLRVRTIELPLRDEEDRANVPKAVELVGLLGDGAPKELERIVELLVGVRQPRA